MLFASLIIEREPLELHGLPAALASWLRDAGGLAAVGLVIWALAYALQRPAWAAGQRWSPRSLLFVALAGLSAVLYGLFVALVLVQGLPPTPPPPPNMPDATLPETIYWPAQNLLLIVAGGLALAAVLLPIVLDFITRIRWRRIWALARLSLKEAWSKGILWVALVIPLIYLYSDWYLTPSHPKDQLAQRIKVVYFALTLLFVVTALLLGSFNIPTDVRNQTIHTVVTKPVERYEIVLGRFIGYALLLLGEVVVLAGVSLFYVERGLEPEARLESHRARVPLWGKYLSFYGTRGENVGREWSYRKYVGNVDPKATTTQFAIWYFERLPGSLADPAGPVPLEFSFDIFRTTKGDERVQGVKCTFLFAPGELSVPEIEGRVRELDRERTQQQAKVDALAEKYGIYVAREVKVTDYHTQLLDVPAALFRKLYQDQDKAAARPGEGPPMALQVLVSLDRSSGPQMLGVARRDLYILAGERPFWVNFLKGSLGLWLAACLVLGIALTCSTYLSGVISLLTTATLCGLGLFLDYIYSVAFGTSIGGGPFEAFYRLANRQGMVVQLDRSSTALDVLQRLDVGFRWYLRRVLSVIPDVKRFDLTNYVASGFDVSWGQMLFADTLVPLLGYLVPCGILAYYLMNSREIANPT